MNQYQKHYDERIKCIPVAEAIYVPRLNTNNPYITALPKRRSIEEFKEACTILPNILPMDILKNHSKEEQIDHMRKISDIRLYLPYYSSIEEIVDRVLEDSYKRRVSMTNETKQEQYIFNKKQITEYQHMKIKELSNAPTGFAILGETGCGKTTGLHNVLRKYPKVIIHNPGTMKQHIQIPVLAVHTPLNSNFHELYEAIGKKLDEYLGNTEKVYENELGQIREQLSKKFIKFCDLIEKFNIGLLVIDEIQLLSKNRISESTLETFMSLANQTGVAIGVIGTEESFSTLFHHPRIARRVGELITADAYCTSKETFNLLLKYLYTYLPVKIQPTQECIDTYYAESKGTLASLLIIMEYVAKTLIKQVSKNKQPSINPDIIKQIAKKHLTILKAQRKTNIKDRIIEDENYTEETLRMLLGKSGIEHEESHEQPEENNETDIPNLSNIVKAAIHAFPNSNFKDEDIESALLKVCKKNDNKNLQEIITAVFIELGKKKNNKKKKEEEKKTNFDLETFRNSLPVANIPGQTTQGGKIKP